MNPEETVIFIIDDDKSVRRSLSLFLKSGGYNVETFASAEEYLERDDFNGIGCILLDVNMEGKSGPELQDELIRLDSHLPIIFMTGAGNVPLSVNALRKGAINFLEKPFKENDLLGALKEGIIWCGIVKSEKDEKMQALELTNALTPREKEVLTYLLAGLLNKQIASELNITEHTVKLHRQSICEKLGVHSVPEILRIADKAGIKPSEKKI
jgi:FixJ family two-component response regulator